jgi:hypothetical protein
LSNLTTLYMVGAKKITNAGVAELQKTLPKVKVTR